MRKSFINLFVYFGLLSAAIAQNSGGDMILIHGGKYEMGIDQSELPEIMKIGKDVPHMSPSHAEFWYGDECPRHSVEVNSFYIDKHEVTNRQFSEFVEATGYKAEGKWKEYFDEERKEHPVVCVTYKDAVSYAKWAGKRLPTEEEWEYAASSGGKHKRFSWGDRKDISKAKWRYGGESFFDGVVRLIFGRAIDTVPVGSFPPNDFGLYDMTGNAGEWTSADYAPYPGYEKLSWKNDTDAFEYKDEGKERKIIRGGNWNSPNPVMIRVTERKGFSLKTNSNEIGFRCAKDAE